MRALLVAAYASLLSAKQGCSPPGCHCSDACRYSRDGECDDGGPNADSSKCGLGTDCHDCGERTEEHLGALMCSNRCRSRRDGHCDDGGPGAAFKTCDFGSDCEDCGPRVAGGTCTDGKVKMCGTGCMFSKDGRCDDGGPGSQYSSCSLGSDCVDCGPREQLCGTAIEARVAASSYTYEAPETSPSPPPWQCEGGGHARCNEHHCNMFMHAETTDCHHCECAGCVFCLRPSAMPPPPAVHRDHSPPPPVPAPPFRFFCAMLDGRSNARLHGGFCYSLPAASCAVGYSYAEGDGGGEAELALCQVINGLCESQHIPQVMLRAEGGCREHLRMPPSPPPNPDPPPAPPNWPTPLPHSPPPPGVPPPTPCVPLSGKCGGSGWAGMSNCCLPADGEARCYRKNAHLSQCRTSCLPGWECAVGSAQQQLHHHPPIPAASEQRKRILPPSLRTSPPTVAPLAVPSVAPTVTSAVAGKAQVLDESAAAAADTGEKKAGVSPYAGYVLPGIVLGFASIAALTAYLISCCCCASSSRRTDDRGYVYSKNMVNLDEHADIDDVPNIHMHVSPELTVTRW